ncbi:hypothetical protein D3C86_1630610 [compost metagenome]
MQLFTQQGVFRAAHGVVQFERHLAQAQFFKLGNHRGDADATGDKQVQARLLDQREQVDWRGDVDQVAFAHAGMQLARTATAVFDPAYGNLVGAGVVGRTHQRVWVAQGVLAVGNQHHDVAAAGKRRQVRAVGRDQGEALDFRGHRFDAGHTQVQGSVVLAHVSSSSACGSSPGTSASALTAWNAARRRE